MKEKLVELKSYREWHDKLIYLNNRIKGVHSITFDGASGGKKTTLGELIDEKNKIIQRMELLEDAINTLDNTYERLVLGYRYMQFYTLEEIAIELGYSTRQISRICKKAVENMK